MKPDAPENVRGEFRPIATTVPGSVSSPGAPAELMAKQAHHLTLVRSVHHTIGDHNAGAYYALTGREPLINGRLITAPGPDNFPPFGSVLAKLRPSGRPLPDFVHLPDWMSNNGSFLPGQDAGFLGSSFEPFVAGDPSRPGYQVPGLELPRELSLDRVGRRRTLLDAVSATLGDGRGVERLFDAHYRGFLPDRQPRGPPGLRPLDRAGPRPRALRPRPRQPPGQGGPPVRRPAPPRPVFIAGPSAHRGRREGRHGLHRRPLRPELGHPPRPLPPAQAVAPADVRPRLLRPPGRDSGRARPLPSRNRPRRRDGRVRPDARRSARSPASAAADKGGRDHWPHCYTVLLAGGGMPRCRGPSTGPATAHAAYPARDPVTPLPDLAATIYRAMGLDPDDLDPRPPRPAPFPQHRHAHPGPGGVTRGRRGRRRSSTRAPLFHGVGVPNPWHPARRRLRPGRVARVRSRRGPSRGVPR